MTDNEQLLAALDVNGDTLRLAACVLLWLVACGSWLVARGL